MKYKEYIRQIIRTYKGIPFEEDIVLLIREKGITKGYLRPVSRYNETLAKMIMRWRESNPIGFANRFEASLEKTENWYKNILLPNEYRILFFIHSITGMVIGHLGYSTFNFGFRSAEVDNVVRGLKGFDKGMMSLALQTLIRWGKERLLLDDIYLRVLEENEHAIKFYERNGFKTVCKIPLFEKVGADIIEWVELPLREQKGRQPDKFFNYMKYDG